MCCGCAGVFLIFLIFLPLYCVMNKTVTLYMRIKTISLINYDNKSMYNENWQLIWLIHINHHVITSFKCFITVIISFLSAHFFHIENELVVICSIPSWIMPILLTLIRSIIFGSDVFIFLFLIFLEIHQNSSNWVSIFLVL